MNYTWTPISNQNDVVRYGQTIGGVDYHWNDSDTLTVSNSSVWNFIYRLFDYSDYIILYDISKNASLTLYGWNSHPVNTVKFNDATVHLRTGGGNLYPVNGGSGVDIVYIDDGNGYKINTNSGNDIIEIRAGNNTTVNAGSGNDIIGINGNNAMYTAPGTYSYFYGGNNHVVAGGAGSDTYQIYWNNSYNASDYKTVLTIDQTGASSTDCDIVQVKGAHSYEFDVRYSGNDAIAVHRISGSTITVKNWTTKNIDKMEFYDSNEVNTETVFMRSSGSNSTVTGTSGLDYIYVAGGSAHNVNAGRGADEIFVSGGSSHVIHGHDDNDRIVISNDNVAGDICWQTGVTPVGSSLKVYGDNGNDTIYLDAGTNHSVSGGAGQDTIYVSKTTGSTINGNAGNDKIVVSTSYGSNTFLGGAGNDCYEILWVNSSSSSKNQYIIDQSGAGTTDVDSVNIVMESSNVPLEKFKYYKDSVGRYCVEDTAANKLLIKNNSSNWVTSVNFYKTKDDIVAMNVYKSVKLSDFGATPNDILVICNSQSVSGSSVANTVNVHSGNNTIKTYAGNDVIRLYNGNNYVAAGDGNDYMNVYGWGESFNTLVGGAGKDSYLMVTSMFKSTHIIIDQASTGVDNDILNFEKDFRSDFVFEYDSSKNGGLVTLTHKSGGVVEIRNWNNNPVAQIKFKDGNVVTPSNLNSMIISTKIATTTVNLTSGNDTYSVAEIAKGVTVNCNNGDDTVELLGNKNKVYGGNGADVINVRGHNDYISSGAGNDVIRIYGNNNTALGGDGRDYLNLYWGADSGNSLRGGNGKDTYCVTMAGSKRTSNVIDLNNDNGVLDGDVVQFTRDASTDFEFEKKNGNLVLTHTTGGVYTFKAYDTNPLEKIMFTDKTIYASEIASLTARSVSVLSVAALSFSDLSVAGENDSDLKIYDNSDSSKNQFVTSNVGINI